MKQLIGFLILTTGLHAGASCSWQEMAEGSCKPSNPPTSQKQACEDQNFDEPKTEGCPHPKGSCAYYLECRHMWPPVSCLDYND